MVQVDSPLQWLRILPSTDPEFGPRVNDLIPPSALASLAQVIPYSVVVTNAGQEALAGIDVRFTLKLGDRTVTRNFFYNSFPDPTRHLLDPGHSILFTPLKTANAFVGRAQVAQGGGGGGGALSSPSDTMALQQLASATEIRVSLDFAATPDGRFAGPDVAHTVKKLTAQWTAYRDMRTECLAQLKSGNLDSSIEEWLTPFLKQKIVRDPDTGWGDEYTATQVTLASEWQQLLGSGRRSALSAQLSAVTPDLRYPLVSSLRRGLQ